MPRPLGVVTAKPQLTKTDSVIASAPVMRNLRSDVTRFVPTNLRVKRDEKKEEKVKRKPEPYSHMPGQCHRGDVLQQPQPHCYCFQVTASNNSNFNNNKSTDLSRTSSPRTTYMLIS